MNNVAMAPGLQAAALPRISRAPSELASCSSKELISWATLARESVDPLLAGRCLEAANVRRSRSCRQVMQAMFPERSLSPIPWLPVAQDAARTVQKSTSGGHHLYVILLDGFCKDGRYGVYVGETRYRPERRFGEHKAGIRAAGAAQRMGLCLLPSLYEHLNPLSRAEAKQFEGALAAVFRSAGITVRGGH